MSGEPGPTVGCQELPMRSPSAVRSNARVPLPAAPKASFRRIGFIEATGARFRNLSLPAAVRDWLKRFYYRVLMLQTGGRGLRNVLPGGEVVRLLPGSRRLGWNLAEYIAFRQAAKPGMVAFDVGANVGAYSLVLGMCVGAEGSVYAFEPVPRIFEDLTQHIRLNHLERQIQPIRAAVGDREGVGELIVAPTAGESRLAAQSEDDAALTRVSLVTIDGFCAQHGLTPDMIKIDVEGWELAVLRGARHTIHKAGQRLSLFVELHPSIWPALGVTRRDVMDELDRLGLDLEPLSPGVDPWTLEGVSVRLKPRER